MVPSRTIALGHVAAGLFTLILAAAGCSSRHDDPGAPPDRASSAETGADPSTGAVSQGAAKLWILNQAGDPSLGDFFDCILSASTWNVLATAYPGARELQLAAEVVAKPGGGGKYPCTVGVGGASYYQCAIDAGHFDMAPGDVLLVVRPDGQVGGLDNPNGSDPTNISYGPNGGVMFVTNPVTHARVSIVGAHVGDATGSPEDLFVYAGHEVFEAQTDGISADCCDGETASGGPLPVCPACGPDRNGDGTYGKCGQYSAPGGSWGIDSITCPSGRTYAYQRVSPPGASRYGSPEFDGTCDAITVTGATSNPCANVPRSDDGEYCGTSTESGFDATRAVPSYLYDCHSGAVARTEPCPAGCVVEPAGQADRCATVSGKSP